MDVRWSLWRARYNLGSIGLGPDKIEDEVMDV